MLHSKFSVEWENKWEEIGDQHKIERTALLVLQMYRVNGMRMRCNCCSAAAHSVLNGRTNGNIAVITTLECDHAIK